MALPPSLTIPEPLNLAGRVAVVTGGGGVLCGAMARALAARGAAVAVLDLKLEAAEAVAAAIRADGGQAVGLAANALDKASLEAAHARVLAELGPCDILVNGAGGNHPKGTTTKEYLFPEDVPEGAAAGITTFFDLAPDGVQFVFNLNFLGTLLPSQVFCRDMAARGRGAVVNISSMNAFTPLTKIPAYSAAKAAVSNFTRWLAVHLCKVNIRVNAIAPGFFLTEQNRTLLTHPDGSFTPRAQKILTATPMGRFGTSNELLGALFWLVDDQAAGFVTGQVIAIDGGFSAYSGV